MKDKSLWKLIKRLWNTPKGKPLIKLILYFVMMLIIVLIISFGYNKAPHDTDVKVSSFELFKKEILKNNFAYKYQISNDLIDVVYEGKKKDDMDIGYKTFQNTITKYLIEDNSTYDITMTDKVLITNLFENINVNYLDLNYIFYLIEDKEPEIIVEEKITTDIYNLTNNKITVHYNEKNIFKIEIENESHYILTFSSVGLITDNDF